MSERWPIFVIAFRGLRCVLANFFSSHSSDLWYIKRLAWPHGSNAKNGLKSDLSWPEIWAKMYGNLTNRTKLLHFCNFRPLSQYYFHNFTTSELSSGMVRLQNFLKSSSVIRTLYWNFPFFNFTLIDLQTNKQSETY